MYLTSVVVGNGSRYLFVPKADNFFGCKRYSFLFIIVNLDSPLSKQDCKRIKRYEILLMLLLALCAERIGAFVT